MRHVQHAESGLVASLIAGHTPGGGRTCRVRSVCAILARLVRCPAIMALLRTLAKDMHELLVYRSILLRDPSNQIIPDSIRNA